MFVKALEVSHPYTSRVKWGIGNCCPAWSAAQQLDVVDEANRSDCRRAFCLGVSTVYSNTLILIYLFCIGLLICSMWKCICYSVCIWYVLLVLVCASKYRIIKLPALMRLVQDIDTSTVWKQSDSNPVVSHHSASMRHKDQSSITQSEWLRIGRNPTCDKTQRLKNTVY